MHMIIPNFLIRGLSEAVQQSAAPKIFVCNIATQHGETDDLSAVDHLRIFQRHAHVAVTHFVVNSHVRPVPSKQRQTPILPLDQVDLGAVVVIQRDVGDEIIPSHHQPAKLASVVLQAARMPQAS